MITSLCLLVHEGDEVLGIVSCIQDLGSEIELFGLEFIHCYNKKYGEELIIQIVLFDRS